MTVVKEHSTPTHYGELLNRWKMPQEQEEPVWLTAFRQKAFADFQKQGLPSRKQEAWRYMNLQHIVDTSWTNSLDAKPLKESVDQVQKSGLAGLSENRIVFINGVFCGELSHYQEPGTVLAPLSKAVKEKEASVRSFFDPEKVQYDNPFDSVNAFNFREGAFLSFEKDTSIPAPVHILFWNAASESGPMAVYPRVLVQVGENSRASLKITYSGPDTDKAFLVNAVHQVRLEKNARLDVLTEYRYTGPVYQLSNTRVSLEQSSHLESSALAFGGAMVRDETSVDFWGKEGFASVNGLSMLSGESQAFHHIFVNHNVPGCTSRQLFKNILGDKAQAEYDSVVHVHRNAFGSDSQQLDRNLLLSDQARTYSRPQLKIYNDDVKCNHGAATGQLEGNELFYLQSRGLDKELAKYLMTFSFAQEILQTVEWKQEREALSNFISKQIKEMVRCED